MKVAYNIHLLTEPSREINGKVYGHVFGEGAFGKINNNSNKTLDLQRRAPSQCPLRTVRLIMGVEQGAKKRGQEGGRETQTTVSLL